MREKANGIVNGPGGPSRSLTNAPTYYIILGCFVRPLWIASIRIVATSIGVMRQHNVYYSQRTCFLPLLLLASSHVSSSDRRRDRL
jgi:hypothetical protein